MVASLSSDIFGSSIVNWPLTDGPLACPLRPGCGVAATEGDIKLLRRRRWPTGVVMGSISMVSVKEVVLEDAAAASVAVALRAREAVDNVAARSAGVDGEPVTPAVPSLLVACARGKATAGDPDAEDSADEVPPLATEVLRRGRRLKAATDSGRGVLRAEEDLERAWDDLGEGGLGDGGGE